MRKRYSIDLSAHMAECDANYARMLALAPDLCAPSEEQDGAGRNARAGASGDDQPGSADSCEFALDMPGSRVELLVELVERSRYTTLVRFTQLMGQEGTGVQEIAGMQLNLTPPTMLIRLYHDARSAEVAEVRNETRFKEVYEYPNPKMRSRDEKAQVNRFLGEYLAMCLRYGLAAEQVAVGQ